MKTRQSGEKQKKKKVSGGSISDEDSPYGGPDGARLALTGQAARNVAMLYSASDGDGDTEGDLQMHTAGKGVPLMHSSAV